jgi:hypothetical protein
VLAWALLLVAAWGCDGPTVRDGATAADRTRLLATFPEEAPSPAPALPEIVGLHAPLDPRPGVELVWSSRGGVAITVDEGTASRAVHNGRPGRAYAAVGDLALSPDGERLAHGALVDGRWRMVVDGVEGPPFDTVDAPIFSPDGAHLAYLAMEGDEWLLVVDGLVGARTSMRFLSHAFSGNSSRILFIEDLPDPARGRLVVSDLAFRAPIVVANDVEEMVLDESGTWVATVSWLPGDRRALLTARLDTPGPATLGPAYDSVAAPVFGVNGSVAYLAGRGDERLVVLDGREEKLPRGELVGPLVVRGAGRGVGALVASGGSVRLHQLFARDPGVGQSYDEAAQLTYDRSGRSWVMAARNGTRWFVVVNGREGPPFDRVVTPRFSPDGERLAYRARQDGRRFVVSANARGRTTRIHPRFDQVFPASFSADGKAVVYGAREAARVVWKEDAL